MERCRDLDLGIQITGRCFKLGAGLKCLMFGNMSQRSHCVPSGLYDEGSPYQECIGGEDKRRRVVHWCAGEVDLIWVKHLQHFHLLLPAFRLLGAVHHSLRLPRSSPSQKQLGLGLNGIFS